MKWEHANDGRAIPNATTIAREERESKCKTFKLRKANLVLVAESCRVVARSTRVVNNAELEHSLLSNEQVSKQGLASKDALN